MGGKASGLTAAARRSRGPMRSLWNTRTWTRNRPRASVLTTGIVGVRPCSHDRRTCVFGGNPVPVAITTVPGGPMSGSTLS